MDKPVERDSNCFCCGPGNDRGLHLVFTYPSKGEAEAILDVPEYFSGWKNTTHGGFLAMLLDEAMAHACLSAGESAVTGEITVRFMRPVETGTRLRISGKVETTKSRLVLTNGWIHDPSGATIAESSGKFVKTVL
jgi:uncharacterized protein (TIGR00369 family)